MVCRPLPPVIGLCVALAWASAPSEAQANPFSPSGTLGFIQAPQPAQPAGAAQPAQPAQPTGVAAPAQPTGAAAPAQPAQPTGAAQPEAPADPSWQPTSSKAPDSENRPEPEPAPEPEPVVVAPAPEPAPVLQEPEPKTEEFSKHGIGIRGGLNVIPTWILSGALSSHTNSLCRANLGGFAESRGLTKVDGCNFYVGGEYIYRSSKILDIVPTVGWHRLRTPDGIWLDNGECVDGDCDLAAGDYTEVNLDFVFIEVDFIARGTIVETPDFAFQFGGGGGIGLGIFTGEGVFQTPIGRNLATGQAGSIGEDGSFQNTCTQLSDYSDFTRCTPKYQDMEENGVPSPAQGDLSLDSQSHNNPNRFASCTKDECLDEDLIALGRTKVSEIPPVGPVVNLMLSMRFLIRDTFGINFQGGWNTGFYFGGSLQYFFGAEKK